MPNHNDYTPLDVAVALSLYSYNVDAGTRAEKLFENFDSACLELDELVSILNRKGEYAATELPAPTAKVYVNHALERYGAEAKRRNAINLQGVTT